MLTKTEAEAIVGPGQEFKIVGDPQIGGQKIVFPCTINNQKYALKFILLSENQDDSDSDDEPDLNSDYERALRETKTMEEINSPFLVKLGPIKLTKKIFNNKLYVFYTEEWIEGRILSNVILNSRECIQLGIDIGSAIKELALKKKIHRDIKPNNIIQRSNGHFVLLDLGLLYDKEDISLTRTTFAPGTIPFYSPEQIDPRRKRDMDFRSDMFSLGIVMFMCITGKYPFGDLGNMTAYEYESNILTKAVPPAEQFNNNIPHSLSRVISRLLEKHPSGRYRNCELLINDLRNIN